MIKTRLKLAAVAAERKIFGEMRMVRARQMRMVRARQTALHR
jgi:hypothetical protein